MDSEKRKRPPNFRLEIPKKDQQWGIVCNHKDYKNSIVIIQV
jgi:hypothetical protein